jgi:hypothetical protein
VVFHVYQPNFLILFRSILWAGGERGERLMSPRTPTHNAFRRFSDAFST